MKILAIEMATRDLSVALFIDGKCVQELEPADQKKSHSEKLMPAIVSLLDNHHLILDDLDAIAFSNGPGSFTSLRVGFATIQGLGLHKSFDYYPVSSLESLAYQSDSTGTLIALMHAGRGRYHIQVFKKDQNILIQDTSIKSPIDEDDLTKLLEKSKNITLIGPKVDEHQNIQLKKEQMIPKASFIGELVLGLNLKPLSFEELKINYAMDPDIG